MVDLNTVSIESKDGLLDYLTLLKDSRKKRGIRHSQISILAVAICALLSGSKCFIAVGERAASLSQEMLKRLGCRYSDRLEKFVPPSEKTLRLALKRVDGDEVDDIIGQWLCSQSQDRAVADGILPIIPKNLVSQMSETTKVPTVYLVKPQVLKVSAL
jgi:hypothetical protein